MPNYLLIRESPVVLECDFRRFTPGERHIARLSRHGVLILMLGGELRFEEDGVPHALRAGEWYIQRPGLRQSGRAVSLEPYYFYVHFDGAFSRDEQDAGALALTGRFDAQSLLPVMQALYDSAGQPNPDAHRLGVQFAYLLYGLQTQREQARGTLGYRIRAYLAGRFDQPLPLSRIAAELGYTERYINRAFRAEYGVSVHRYLVRLRLEKACRLLRGTDRGIQEIAADCGFSDASSFYRAFVHEYGASPGKWRKRNETP